MNFRSSLTLFILLVPFTAAYSTDKQAEGIALIQRAVDLTDLHKGGPYRMRATLTYDDEGAGKREGISVENFVSPERWRLDVQVTHYNEISIFLGAYRYRSRNTHFTPPILRGHLAGSLRELSKALNFKVIRVYDRKYKGVEARCVYLEDRTQLRPEEVRWCFAVTTGLPVVTLMAYETWYTEFTSYKPFGNRFVPGKIELFELGKSRAAAVIESIDPNVPNQDIIFKLPAEAIGRRWCEDMHPPRYLSGRRIAMPDRSLVAQQGLELTYEVTIGENGRVLEVVPMEEKAFIDMPVFAAVYTWRYEPARCGGTPVPTDIVLSPWFITHGHRNF